TRGTKKRRPKLSGAFNRPQSAAAIFSPNSWIPSAPVPWAKSPKPYSKSAASTGGICRLLDDPDRQRIPVRHTVIRLNRRNDRKNDMRQPENDQQQNPYQHENEQGADNPVNQHRNVEIQRFLPLV